MKNYSKAFLVILLAFLFSACGGGSDDKKDFHQDPSLIDEPSHPDPSTPSDEFPAEEDDFDTVMIHADVNIVQNGTVHEMKIATVDNQIPVINPELANDSNAPVHVGIDLRRKDANGDYFMIDGSNDEQYPAWHTGPEHIKVCGVSKILGYFPANNPIQENMPCSTEIQILEDGNLLARLENMPTAGIGMDYVVLVYSDEYGNELDSPKQYYFNRGRVELNSSEGIPFTKNDGGIYYGKPIINYPAIYVVKNEHGKADMVIEMPNNIMPQMVKDGKEFYHLDRGIFEFAQVTTTQGDKPEFYEKYTVSPRPPEDGNFQIGTGYDELLDEGEFSDRIVITICDVPFEDYEYITFYTYPDENGNREAFYLNVDPQFWEYPSSISVSEGVLHFTAITWDEVSDFMSSF